MSENIVIENEFTSVVLSPEVGASLRSILVKKNGSCYELLAGANKLQDSNDILDGSGSFIMAPWVNRIRDGTLVARDGIHNLPISDPPHAIHGLVRQRPWTVGKVTDTSAKLEIELAEPWPYKGRVEYAPSLVGRSFVQTLRLIAAPKETRPFPGGLGWHPWFNRTLGSSEMYIQSNVVSQWDLDSTMTAQGTRRDSEAAQRLRHGTQFKTGEIDGCFLAAPGCKAVLTWPELTLTITGSETLTHVLLYSPEHAICVEPQTSTIDAAQLEGRGITGTGHVLVKQTNPLIATTTWSWDE